MNSVKPVSAMEELDEMKSQISNFSFETCSRGSQGFTHLQIQLFGFLGHGKSSFINTCKYVWEDGLFVNYTNAKISQGGDTKARFSYPVTDSITLVDNRGCATMDDYETGEIYAQLGNLLPFNDEVEWNKGFGVVERIIDAEDKISKSDFIFPVLVYSVTHNSNDEECNTLRQLLKNARDLTGIFPIIVLTHKTRGNIAEKERLFEGMGAERIFAFENYTPQDHFKTRGKHEDVLKFLLEVIRDVQFRMFQPRDPINECKVRKQFVLKHVHAREIRNKEQEIEIQKQLNEQKIYQEQEKLKKAQEEHRREMQKQRMLEIQRQMLINTENQPQAVNVPKRKAKGTKNQCNSQ